MIFQNHIAEQRHASFSVQKSPRIQHDLHGIRPGEYRQPRHHRAGEKMWLTAFAESVTCSGHEPTHTWNTAREATRQSLGLVWSQAEPGTKYQHHRLATSARMKASASRDSCSSLSNMRRQIFVAAASSGSAR